MIGNVRPDPRELRPANKALNVKYRPHDMRAPDGLRPIVSAKHRFVLLAPNPRLEPMRVVKSSLCDIREA
jgi:hypothetical protein